MAKRVKGVSATSALVVSRVLPRRLIAYTTVVKSPLRRFCIVVQAHSEGSSLRGISRSSGLADETVVSVINAASQKAQMLHNQELKAVDTESIGASEFWSFVERSKNTVTATN
jgi:lambda repressor-like predicted transcriptional regulator